MARAPIVQVGLPAALCVLGAIFSVSLTACAPVHCPAVAVADNFSVSAKSATHSHLLLALCDPTRCTAPLNASSKDLQATLRSTPALELYATSDDHWRVSMLDSDSTPTSDPKTVSVEVWSDSTRLTSRTITLSWMPAAGPCSHYNTAGEVRIALP